MHHRNRAIDTPIRRGLSFSRRHPASILLRWLVVLVSGIWLADAAVADEFPPVEQVFHLSGEAKSPTELVVRWQIEPGYYLYQSQLRLRSTTEGVSLGKPELPEAKVKQDDFFGEVKIYRDQAAISIPIERSDPATRSLRLLARFQGCADAGFCYPPEEIPLELPLPAVLAPTAPASESDPLPDPFAALRQSAAKTPAGFGLEEDILPAEDAFVFDAQIADPNRLELRWNIAPDTYLYRERITVELSPDSAAAGVELGELELPRAEIKPEGVRPDGSIGEVAVYHDLIEAELPLLRTRPQAAKITLIAKFQGCAERGICYPPVTATISLELPPTDRLADPPTGDGTPAGGPQPAALAAQPPATEFPLSEQDRIAAQLASGGLLGGLTLFFGLGLLLAFTPCIFPMIPILSGIIAGHGKQITTKKAFSLSAAYVLAMALTYAVAGVIAGLFGANLQAAFQAPWVLTLFAALFVALALSMFGFFELQLPSALQTRLTEVSNKQQGGTLIGAAIMGLLSALIVGPCVAPPLMGALIFIGQTGDAVLGFFALLGLGLGMGAPLLLIGASAGKLLPRAGAWMDSVKAVFGVLLLGVAMVLLERILPPAVALLLWGLLLIGSGVFLGALDALAAGGSGWRKLWKSLGVALLIYGTLMLVGAAAGGNNTLQPLRGLVSASAELASPASAEFKRIKTVLDLEQELAAAQAQGKPVLLDFYADWCVSCREMERDTFPHAGVRAALGDFVLLQADVTANDAEDRLLMQERFGLPGPPAMLFFDSTGQERRGSRLVGFIPADDFIEHLRMLNP